MEIASGTLSAPAAPTLGSVNGPPRGAATDDAARLKHALEVREAFTDFFGHTFYSQLIKSMRTSVGDPAYFHGGRAEKVFQGQLDQTLAEEMSAASAPRLAAPMFEHQFPQLAELIAEHQPEAANDQSLGDLSLLSRR